MPVSEDVWTLLTRWETVGASEPEIALAPWLDPAYYGETVKTPSYIPTDLLDYLTSLLKRGKGYESIENCGAFLDRYAADQREEDARNVFETYIKDEDWAMSGDWSYQADVDNDGIGDMPLFKDVGTGHYIKLYFLRGDGSGGYENIFTVWKTDRCRIGCSCP